MILIKKKTIKKHLFFLTFFPSVKENSSSNHHPLQLCTAVIELHLNIFVATVKVVDTVTY